MTYTRKTYDEYVIQSYITGSGWNDDCFEETRKEAKARLKEYKENCNWPVRLIVRRIKINPENK